MPLLHLGHESFLTFLGPYTLAVAFPAALVLTALALRSETVVHRVLAGGLALLRKTVTRNR